MIFSNIAYRRYTHRKDSRNRNVLEDYFLNAQKDGLEIFFL